MTSRTATAAQRANAARQCRASPSKEGAFTHVYTRSSTESLQVNTGMWRESGMALAAATHDNHVALNLGSRFLTFFKFRLTCCCF